MSKLKKKIIVSWNKLHTYTSPTRCRQLFRNFWKVPLQPYFAHLHFYVSKLCMQLFLKQKELQIFTNISLSIMLRNKLKENRLWSCNSFCFRNSCTDIDHWADLSQINPLFCNFSPKYFSIHMLVCDDNMVWCKSYVSQKRWKRSGSVTMCQSATYFYTL